MVAAVSVVRLEDITPFKRQQSVVGFCELRILH